MTAKGTMYEDNGSTLIFDTNNGEYWSFTYDIFNRLVKVSKSTAGTAGLAAVAEYTYDAENLRIRKSSVKNGDTWYVYGLSGEVLYEETAKDTTSYVYVNGRHFAMVETDTTTNTSATYFWSLDHLGSTVMVTDAAGKVVWQNEATPFGEWSGEVGVMHLKGKFTGKDQDEETGLYYYNARWMDPETGRFISSDPMEDGSNWYAYGANNPLVITDPTVMFGNHTTKADIVGRDEFVNSNPDLDKKEASPGYARYQETATKNLGRNGINDNGTAQERINHIIKLLPKNIPDFLMTNTLVTYQRLWSYDMDNKSALLKALSMVIDYNQYLKSGRKDDNGFINLISGKYGLDVGTVISDFYMNATNFVGWSGNNKPISQEMAKLDKTTRMLLDTYGDTICGAVMIPGMFCGGAFKGNRVSLSSKIQKQMDPRGWTEETIDNTINNPYKTSAAKNKATGNDATAYFNENGSYVVQDNLTKEIIQISNTNDPNWVPDPTIVNPYKP